VRRLGAALLLAALATPALAQTPRLDELLAQAEAAASAGRSAEAEQLLRAAATRFSSVRALLRLGRLQAARKNAKAALAAVDEARTLAPNSEEVLSTYAQLALAMRAPAPAIRALEPLTRLCPEVAQHHYLLGVALLQAGDMASAVDALQQARALESDRPLTLVALGLALNNRKLYAEARDALARALDLDPANVEALAAAAEAEEGLGEMTAAEEHAQRALAQAPGHATANLVVGMLRMKQDRYADARDALLRAQAGDPDAPKTLYLLSLAYARLGDETASQTYREAYQKQLRATEERVERIRKEGGFAAADSRQ
jgi:tetratricopeptide (TPR) repeat protein